MNGDLTVGINAQISPKSPGGSETQLLSLIRQLTVAAAGERFVLICVRQHMDELTPFMGANQTPLAWPFPQVGFASPPMAADGRWTGLRARAGRLAPAVDMAYRWYGRIRPDVQGNPAPHQADPVLRAKGVSVVHFPYPLCFGTNLPFIYEPWDLQHRHYPEFFPADEWTRRDRHYRDACQRAALVITATRWVKQDIIAQYGIPATKVAVIPRGSLLARQPLSAAARADAWRRHHIPKDFAFYPAMTFPHKNHIRLLQALARLRDERGIILPLVCSGRIYQPHWPTIEAEIVRLQLQEQVIFLGPVSDPLQASLFQNARFLIFPSLFEGLALPILEAIHYGLPVLAADSTCIPEVAADGALLFDGLDVTAMMEILAEAVGNPATLDRVRSRGPAVLARFSWEKAVKTVIACYRLAAGRPLSGEQQILFKEATEA